MNVLILLKTFRGGTGTFVKNLSAISDIDKKISIKVISLENYDNLDQMGLSVESFTKDNYYPEKYNFFPFGTFLKEIIWLHRITKKFRPDIILTIDAHCLILVKLKQFLFHESFKIVATIHNNIHSVLFHKTPSLFVPIVKYLIRYSLIHSDSIITISNDLAGKIQSFFHLPEKPKVIYYGLSDMFSSSKSSVKRLPRSEKPKTILTLSRLVPQKDVQTLINAFSIAKKKVKHISLLVAGEGFLKDEIQKLSNKIGGITLLGWRDDQIELMKKSHIFVLSSNWEGFGYVLIEAMSQGLPVISTDTPYGPAEILENGKYGLLIPMKDPEAMSKALSELLLDKKKYHYFSEMSLKRSKLFSKRNMLKNYQAVLKDVYSQK